MSWQEAVAVTAGVYFAVFAGYLMLRKTDGRLLILAVVGAGSCGLAQRAIAGGSHDTIWFVPLFVVGITAVTISLDRTLRSGEAAHSERG